MKSERWAVVAIVAAAILPFLATLTFGFVYDDVAIVLRNDAIRGWPSLLALWTKPYWVVDRADSLGLYRPLQMVLFSILWNAGLRFPIWFHLVVVAAHAAASVLVWRVLRRAVAPIAALVAALWFAVHPLHIEAVANIANSSEILVTIAVLALTLRLLRVDASPTWTTALAAGGWYAAALLTKESGVTAPALALLVVWGWHRPGRAPVYVDWRRWGRVAAVCAAVLCAVVATRIAVLGGVASNRSIAAPGLEGLSAPARVWSMLSLGPKVIELLVWPRALNPYYGPDLIAGRGGPSAPALAFIAIALAAGAIAWRLAARGDRRVAVALAWIAIAFLPASNLLVPSGQILAERTLYLPSVGMVLLAGVAMDAVRERVPRVVLATAGALLLVVASVTALRARAWRSFESVYRQMIVADPRSHRGYWLLAMYRRSDQPAEALTLFNRAYSLYQRDREMLVDYAETLLRQGDAPRAASVATGLMAWPEMRRRPEAVALYLESLGRGFGADSVLAAGTRLNAADPLAATAFYVGSAYEVRGDRAKAAATYAEGLRLARPNDTAWVRRIRARVDSAPH